MAILPLADLKNMLGRNDRLMGLDVGSKTVGLAMSDVNRTIATPAETIRRGKFKEDAGAIHAIAAENGVAAYIIGLPVSMDGTEGPRCQSIRQFAKNLDEAIGADYAFWDERLSTSAVERILIRDADMTRKRRAEVVDKMAAAYILQGALDAMAHMTGAAPSTAHGTAHDKAEDA